MHEEQFRFRNGIDPKRAVQSQSPRLRGRTRCGKRPPAGDGSNQDSPVRTSEKTGRGAKGLDAAGFQRSVSDPVQKKFLRLNKGQFL